MTAHIILASGSEIRAQLLRQAAVPFEIIKPKVDEEMVKSSLIHEEVAPRDIADALAELKAGKIGNTHPDAFVIGCDQVLDYDGKLLSKPATPEDAVAQLRMLRGARHTLFSAAVIVNNGQPVWRHVGQVRLRMTDISDAYLDNYVARNWASIRHSVGAYKLEEEGVRLFNTIDGNYFNVLGMPLLELLAFLRIRGVIET
jgi:septum formation protein